MWIKKLESFKIVIYQPKFASSHLDTFSHFSSVFCSILPTKLPVPKHLQRCSFRFKFFCSRPPVTTHTTLLDLQPDCIVELPLPCCEKETIQIARSSLLDPLGATRTSRSALFTGRILPQLILSTDSGSSLQSAEGYIRNFGLESGREWMSSEKLHSSFKK